MSTLYCYIDKILNNILIIHIQIIYMITSLIWNKYKYILYLNYDYYFYLPYSPWLILIFFFFLKNKKLLKKKNN